MKTYLQASREAGTPAVANTPHASRRCRPIRRPMRSSIRSRAALTRTPLTTSRLICRFHPAAAERIAQAIVRRRVGEAR